MVGPKTVCIQAKNTMQNMAKKERYNTKYIKDVSKIKIPSTKHEEEAKIRLYSVLKIAQK